MKDSHQEANIDTYQGCLLGVANSENMRIYKVNGDMLTEAHAQTNIKFTFTRVNTSGGGGSSVTLSGNYEIKEANGSIFTMNMQYFVPK